MANPESRVKKLNLKGKIQITLNDRLHSNNEHINNLIKEIMDIIQNSENIGQYRTPLCDLDLNLSNSDNLKVDITTMYREMWETKPQEAHGVIFTDALRGQPIDPIELIIMSKKTDKILEAIKEKIKKAAIKQLPKSKPAVISCFLQDIEDMTGLASESGLQAMSSYLLNKEDFSHVAAIIYCSEPRVESTPGVENFHSQGLLFRNQNCTFEYIKTYDFISKL